MDLDYAMRVGDPYLFRENTAELDTLGDIICRPHERPVFETRRPPGLGHLLSSFIVALLFTTRAINKDTVLYEKTNRFLRESQLEAMFVRICLRRISFRPMSQINLPVQDLY